jgi:hypothetical protein
VLKANGKKIDLEFRSNQRLCKIDCQWLVLHEHHSIPLADLFCSSKNHHSSRHWIGLPQRTGSGMKIALRAAQRLSRNVGPWIGLKELIPKFGIEAKNACITSAFLFVRRSALEWRLRKGLLKFARPSPSPQLRASGCECFQTVRRAVFRPPKSGHSRRTSQAWWCRQSRYEHWRQ